MALASAQNLNLNLPGRIPIQQRVTNWGNQVYGPGANNQFAFPPNPILMQRAIQIANLDPNLFVVSISKCIISERFTRLMLKR